MGSYLKFDGRENNSKSISYPMGTIIREIKKRYDVNDKYILEDEKGFSISKKGLAFIVSYSSSLIEDETWCKKHIYKYVDTDTFETSIYDTLYTIWTEVLCEMILLEKKRIRADWEG